MNVIDELRHEREELARVLQKHPGIRRIVEDLYPDSAHFIYELLQNAEDTGATEAHFALDRTALVFEHNGRPFEPRDIDAITDIGEGTKAGDDDKIGRYGVGFKAVFAYSETPHIWSPTFSFMITDLVLPSPLAPEPDLGGRTRFEFPFNNPKKAVDVAFAEVAKGLNELAETTLLFLSHLQSVSWQVGGGPAGKVLRVLHSENHIEVLKKAGTKTTGRSHFLKFDQPVTGLEKQRVAVAFALDFLPNVPTFDPAKPLAMQLKIIPAAPGRVAVFFPAEKEVSGFRFHLHGPFVPELSRASIKETPANLPLFEQLAALAAASLHRIRDLDLLSAEFLEVLPNARDQVAERYDVIRSAIIRAMNNEPLTPTHAKSHSPAKDLLQGKASLKSLLSDEDLEFLIDYEDAPRLWAVGVAQKHSNADRFLDSLAIGTWDIDDFVELLCNKTSGAADGGPPENISPDEVRDWLRGKSVEWHQELYALLLTDHLTTAGYQRDTVASTLGSLRIVRLTDGAYGPGSESFFVTDGIEHDEGLARVDERVYTTGRSKSQKENARAFLEEIGVREIGEAELVEAVLKKRYTREAEVPDEKTYRRDLKRFVELVEHQPDKAELFGEYWIFQGVDLWRTPGQIFLDQPFVDTSLSAYYDALGEQADRAALSGEYSNCGVSAKRLVSFAVAVGASKGLAIQPASCWSNPNARQFVHAAPGNRTQYGIDRDFYIPGLDDLLPTTNAALSQLIWRTLCGQEDDSWTTAKYRNNSSYAVRSAPSQLTCLLRDQEWVPQMDGRFVRPAEATHDLLPSGFPFDHGWEWLKAIGFGQQLAERCEEESQRRTLARQLGFGDDDTLDRARRFAALPPEEQRRILAEQETRFELPDDREPANPTRRAERVAAQAAAAPERETEEHTRSVSVNRDAVKEEAGQYLRQQYTNTEGQMMCQVCKKRVPFQRNDGSDYFERVEFLPTLKRHHKQNYLALCPNHAAMVQHANGCSAEKLRDMVTDLDRNELPVVLAREDATIYFTKTHLADLKAIISADESEAEPDGSETGDESEATSPAESGSLSGQTTSVAHR
jgi:hypothetical protein